MDREQQKFVTSTEVSQPSMKDYSLWYMRCLILVHAIVAAVKNDEKLEADRVWRCHLL